MDEDLMREYEQKLKEAKNSADQSQIGIQQGHLDLERQELGMIAEQLDVGPILDKIHNLLRGYVLVKDDAGNTNWVKPKNNDLIVLSDFGVTTIMRIIQMYINKNTLLSNYDDVQIMAKMEDISNAINDLVFMKYDKIFLYPTLEDCKDELKKRIRNKVDIKMFAKELVDPNWDKKSDEEIAKMEEDSENEIIKEMESRIERELTVIRSQKIKDKLKDFEMLTRTVQDVIHSTYQRAWKGQERSTLRTHMTISETKGGMIIPQNQSSGFNPLGILGRR